MIAPVSPDTISAMRMESLADSIKQRQHDEAVEGLEAMFLHALLREMRETIPEGGFLEKTHAQETMEGMMDEYLAADLAKSGQLGIARMVSEQLRKNGEDVPNE